jgi:hypothetical protein
MATEWQDLQKKLRESLHIRRQMLADLKDRLAQYGIDSDITDEPPNLELEVRADGKTLAVHSHAENFMFSWRVQARAAPVSGEYIDGGAGMRQTESAPASLPDTISYIRRWSLRAWGPGLDDGFRPPGTPS